MPGVFEQLLVALVGFVVMAYPGTFVLAAAGAHHRLDSLLRLPAAFAVTLVMMGCVLVPSLWQGWSIAIIAIIWGGISLASAATGVVCERRRAGRESWSAMRWLMETSPIGWIAAWPLGVRLVALAAAIITFIAGGWLDDGDMQYHTAIARKIAELDHPTFASIQAFIDGSLHPGYPAPPFHALVAVQAFMTSTDTATVMWMIAVPAAVVSVAVWAGLGRVLFGSTAAATLTAVSWMLIAGLARVPLLGALAGAAAPNAVALQTLVPLAVACWIIALEADSRAERRVAGVLLTVIVVPAITLVHASYLTFLAIIIAGYLLVWGAWSRPTRASIARHARISIALAVSAAACLVAMWPSLRVLATFDAAAVAAARQSEFDQYRNILVGTPDHFHLHWSMLFWFGGLCWVGALGCLLATSRRQEPSARYLFGGLVAIVCVTQIDGIFTVFSHAVSVHQSKRIGVVLPVIAGYACLLLAVGERASHEWRSGRRVLTIAGIAGISIALGCVTYFWRALSEFSAWTGPTWPWFVLVGGAIVVGGVGCVLRIRHHDTAAYEVHHMSRAGATAIAIVLLIGTAPVTRSAARVVSKDLRNRPASALRAYDLVYLDKAVLPAITALPRASVVMAPVEYSLRIQAAAPVYTAAIPVANCARTRANRPSERRDLVETFFAPSTPAATRLSILRSEHIDYIYTTARTASVRAWLVSSPEAFTRIGGGRAHEIWRVDQ